MKCIIFSKDRAMQLHCLLDSIKQNAPIFKEVEVIYKTRHYESYTLLKGVFPWVKFTEETIFKDDFLRAIKRGINCLLVDDDIIFRPVSDLMVIEAMDEADVFSIRLGDNIRHQKHFAVNGSVDGNFFHSDTLRKVHEDRFLNPNQLETKLVRHTKDLTMAWPKESCLIGIPNNRVSSSSGCSHMGGDVDELDSMYLMGYRIDWREMNLKWDNVHKDEQYILKCSLVSTQ